MLPKVTIIIPFYNDKYVPIAIQSALDQTYPNTEVIVVDDGSTEEVDKIQPYMEQITYIRKENGGTATALNYGIQHSTGEYIAWLSSDDMFLPHKIQVQMDYMLANNAPVSFSNYHLMDKDNEVFIPWCGKRFSPTNNLREVYETFLTVNPVNGCTIVIRKDVLDTTGAFNPGFLYTHDYDLWFRILLSGFRMHYIDQPLIHFRSHEGSGTSRFQPQIIHEMNTIETHYRPILEEYLQNHPTFY
ncbi:Glycosyl transferase family 2 [Terribacillus aidingensis]|uniref:Glycosyl transferase family 2 n=1 Tax=Terribacillus aidingensis TaxID=586416 RepID=A0A285N2B6_9BACI|nr:glycosyltransferase [Terribacillus aidingensis]SNZ03592.1 Glycosyl transferase family 2 [Terribacillus aidingensis]